MILNKSLARSSWQSRIDLKTWHSTKSSSNGSRKKLIVGLTSSPMEIYTQAYLNSNQPNTWSLQSESGKNSTALKLKAERKLKWNKPHWNRLKWLKLNSKLDREELANLLVLCFRNRCPNNLNRWAKPNKKCPEVKHQHSLAWRATQLARNLEAVALFELEVSKEWGKK